MAGRLGHLTRLCMIKALQQARETLRGDDNIQKPYVARRLTFDDKRYIAMSCIVLVIWLLAMWCPSWL